MTDKKAPWDQRPGEPARAHGYALDYFNLGPHRSLADVIPTAAKRLKPLQKLPSLGTLKNLSSKWRWRKRAAAYDAWSDGKRVEEAEVEAVEEAKKRVQRRREACEDDHKISLIFREQLKLMAKIPLTKQTKVTERHPDGQEKVTYNIEPARWGKGDMVRFWEAAKTFGLPDRNDDPISPEKVNDVLNYVDFESARKGTRKK
jgi:hypothetical protein